MVLNDIIEQAAGRQSRASDHGGNCQLFRFRIYLFIVRCKFVKKKKFIVSFTMYTYLAYMPRQVCTRVLLYYMLMCIVYKYIYRIFVTYTVRLFIVHMYITHILLSYLHIYFLLAPMSIFKFIFAQTRILSCLNFCINIFLCHISIKCYIFFFFLFILKR